MFGRDVVVPNLGSSSERRMTKKIALKLKTLKSSETSVNIYQSTRRKTPEDMLSIPLIGTQMSYSPLHSFCRCASEVTVCHLSMNG